MNTLSKALTATLLALGVSSAFADGIVEHNTQAFLDALNAGTGKPLELSLIHISEPTRPY